MTRFVVREYLINNTIQISSILVALNVLNMMAAGITNSYIIAPHKEKIWTTLESEFVQDKEKYAIIVQALFSLKSALIRERIQKPLCQLYLFPRLQVMPIRPRPLVQNLHEGGRK